MDEQTKAMHDILSKLQGVDKTTKIVAERAENDVDLNIAINQKITENSVSVQNYRIDIVLQKFADKQKRFYNICEDNKILHKDIALFETAMGVVKNLILNKNKKVEDLLNADLNYNNALYEVYMYKTKARKSINEDVMLAKMSQAQVRLQNAKQQILQKL
jgi:hypothetical protein|tara:strand:+ start:581 stop:1060 length:480 start_codon:yes stop_codon:yes gene_type:complete